MAKAFVAEPSGDFRNDDPAEFLVDEHHALALLGGKDSPIHRSTLWRGIKSGRYPPPVKVGPNINRWDRRKLIAVVEEAASASVLQGRLAPGTEA